MDLLQGQLSEGLVDQLSQQLGGASKEQTANAASGIMTTLMGALAKNASNPEGAQALNNALERDHDGSILDDVVGMLSGTQSRSVQNERTMNGTGIIKHILGDKTGNAIDMISKMSGMEKGNTGNLMSILAPLVMGTLGKAKKQQGLDIGGLTSLLSGTVSAQQQKDPTMSLVTKFLDSDGDGSIIDDVANLGMKFLGGLFKKK
ncbi:MAG: DUF937 domain-containing protein, partial [Bacteroidota bacterium]